ncbi:HDOD domain-containing protein [Shewanella livingstonensis]|uniref:HDOD domain-containing protein n=1 Tax=Shewanella livingstonensis TaxID=150120 RepID=A0A3G8LQI5_9GAMM|nr:HDOD domain-containing protein [Shewanella livingstonensis]AZG71495.1 HDOD domain-containing protein [Shewanella livingstonensis]
MVIGFFKKLFNIRDRNEQVRFTGITAAEKRQQAKPQIPVIEVTEKQAVESQLDLSTLFYSFLFISPYTTTTGIANNLERSVIQEIELALSSPKSIAENVLKLPSKILELDKKLADDNIDIQELIQLIEQDPLLCVEVLKLCNSPAFKRADNDVNSIQQALVQVGRQLLRQFITTCLARELIDIKPIYFRRFGAEIWRHSMQVAFLASELASADQRDSAFLLGLLHDVGKIAIFKMLVDAFYQAEPGEQPSSMLFKQVMTTKSLTLSALLARHWQLPQHVETPLSLLANTNIKPTDDMTLLIWKANIISECSMLQQVDKLPQPALIVLLTQVDLSEQEFAALHQKLIKF